MQFYKRQFQNQIYCYNIKISYEIYMEFYKREVLIRMLNFNFCQTDKIVYETFFKLKKYVICMTLGQSRSQFIVSINKELYYFKL